MGINGYSFPLYHIYCFGNDSNEVRIQNESYRYYVSLLNISMKKRRSMEVIRADYDLVEYFMRDTTTKMIAYMTGESISSV
jgi:hypothetical protein